MRTRLAGMMLICAASALGTYTYEYTSNTSTWQYNYGGGYNYILSTPITFANPNDYETSVSVSGGGGHLTQYLRASTIYLSPGSGSYVSIDIDLTYALGLSIPVTINQTISGVTTQLGSAMASRGPTTTIRSLIFGSTVKVYVDDKVIGTFTITPTTGPPGWGVDNNFVAGGTTFTYGVGHHDIVAPFQIGSTIPVSSYSSFISFQWPATTDDANGVGLAFYEVYRNGTFLGSPGGITTGFVDKTVTPGTAYTYSIDAVDYHGNVSAARTFSVTAPPVTSPDPRRPGVRTDGAYWGGGGEQIDMQGGNLNFSLPLVAPQSRTGGKVPLGISYNAQNWRQDSGANWQLGGDIGYGFGWRISFGSITPYYVNWTSGVDHYVFTDGSGAEYNLDVNTSGVWSSQESLYMWFDANTSILHFKDGAFWVMGCTSGGDEFDAGSMYPTIIEDTSGNQITIAYDGGMGLAYGSPYAAYNTSSRIANITDPRAPCCSSSSTTYQFWYYGRTYPSIIPSLTSIANNIGSGEAYTFTYTVGSMEPPFGPDANYAGFTTPRLTSIAVPTGGSYSFAYDTAGASELTQMTLPTHGYLKWTYSTETYLGGRSLRAVTSRALHMDSFGTTEYTYPITRDSVASSAMHATATIVDASTVGAKTWTFNVPGGSTPSWQYGLTAEFQQKASASGTVITDDTFTWAQNAAGHPFVATKSSISDPGTANMLAIKTTQTQDQYGNATQLVTYPFNNTTTPLKTYNSAFLTDTTYLANYIRDRLLYSTVTFGSTTKMLIENTYDGRTFPQNTIGAPYCAGSLWMTTQLVQNAIDPTPPIALGQRGWLSGTKIPAKTICRTFYTYGAISRVIGSDGLQIQMSSDSATNFAAPQTISSATYSESLSYNSWLGMTSTTGLNGEQLQMTYDTVGRPISATSPFGAVTTYGYANAASPPFQTKSGPNGVATIILDGLGRPIKSRYGAIALEWVVATQYAPCACSPLGKLQRTSTPFAYGTASASAWTTYAYDAIGRTLNVTQPDGASKTTYSYAGATTTVTDPAGKWKAFTKDVEGNLIIVTEPDPANPLTATLTTTYTYDWMNNLVGVSMPRGAITQTRMFVFDDAKRLTSATNPENGTVAYYYNTDNTLWYKHDARGEDTVYTYDSTQRVTKIQRYPTGKSNTEDACQQVNYTYDANLTGSTFSSNYAGRLTAVQYGICALMSGVSPSYFPTVTEMYSYHATGSVTAKRMQLQHPWLIGGAAGPSDTFWMDATYAYNSAGMPTSVTVPMASSQTKPPNPYSPLGGPPITYTTTYDAGNRPISMSDSSMNDSVTSQPVLRVKTAQYDFANRMTSLQLYTGSSANYDPYYCGCFASYTPSYITQTQTYDLTTGQLATLGWSGMGTITYGYSATQNNGQVTQVTDSISGETVVYQYDGLKRLTSAASTPIAGSTPTAWTETYGYDGFGNLTSKVLNGTAGTLGVDATTNHLTSASYDANGNMTSGAGGTLAYDEANRMESFSPVSGGTEKYSYSPDNRRIYKLKADGVTEELTFYGGRGEKLGVYAIYGATNGSNDWSMTMANQMVSMYFAGKQIWEGTTLTQSTTLTGPSGGVVLQDRLGTNRASGARFRPYGDEITSTAQDREKFATYNRDGFTGLDYANQRYYASTYGRYDNPDPGQSGTLEVPMSLNLYSYVGGDPVNQVDPTGLCALVLGGITQTPGSDTTNYQQEFANTAGAISAYPYSNGNVGADAMSVVQQGMGVPTGATATVLNAIALAAQNPGPIDIFAISGGAQSFNTALSYLTPEVRSRIHNVTYISPGTPAQGQKLAGGTGETTVFADLSSLLDLMIVGNVPGSATFVNTMGCGHNPSCVFKNFADQMYSKASQCDIGGGGVLGLPNPLQQLGSQFNIFTSNLFVEYWWSFPGVSVVTTKFIPDPIQPPPGRKVQ